jgi:cytochrome c-type biogenesis protein
MSFSLPTIFVAGLLTFASPCVLPLIPIFLATLAGGSLHRAHPLRAVAVASAFSLGLASVFVSLGALASSLGGFLVTYRTPITLASGALMVLFGARTLGLLRVAALERDVRPALARIGVVSSLSGAFLFGMAFALGWSPCIGPVLAAILAYAATHAHSPMRGALYLGVYAAGLALPLLLLAACAGRAAAWIKRARRAIPRLEQVTGVALVAVGVWMFYSALPPALDRAETLANSAAPSCDAQSSGHACALPQGPSGAPGALDVAAPLAGAQMLEFTSHDCAVCRRMRPVVEKLVAACMELDARFVRVDVTTSRGRALADRYGVRGTPTYVLLDEHGVERARLLGESSSEELAAAVERAFGLSCWG